IFRLLHTIKGTCGFLGLPRLEKVAHAAENVLGKGRDGVIIVTPDMISLVLKAVDQIKAILAGLAATGGEPAGDDTELVAALNATASGRAAPERTPAPLPVAPSGGGPRGGVRGRGGWGRRSRSRSSRWRRSPRQCSFPLRHRWLQRRRL